MFITRLFQRRSGRTSDQRGDTIVEVLIAIAVVSVILGGAYVTTNHSLLDTRDAQERSNAVSLVEGQLEALRSLAATNSNSIFVTAPGSFCVTGGSTIVVSSSSSCQVDSTDTATSTQPIYNLSIVQSTATSGGLKYTTFTVSAWWYSVLGKGKDTLQMTYKLDQ